MPTSAELMRLARACADRVSLPRQPRQFPSFSEVEEQCGEEYEDLLQVLAEDEVNPVMTAVLENGLDVTALHNKYTLPEVGDPPGPASPYVGANKKVCHADEQDVAPFEFTIPDLPESLNPIADRPVFTVTDGANAQDVIDAALASSSPAVVHFPSGKYYQIGSTLTLPAQPADPNQLSFVGFEANITQKIGSKIFYFDADFLFFPPACL